MSSEVILTQEITSFQVLLCEVRSVQVRSLQDLSCELISL